MKTKTSKTSRISQKKFERVLMRIEQGESTVYDARFIRDFVASISQRRVISGNHS